MIKFPLLATMVFTICLQISAQDGNVIEPKELSELRESWLAAKERESLSIMEEHLKVLASLRDQVTERGQLDDAVLVREEIKRLAQDPKILPPDSATEDTVSGLPELQRLTRSYETSTASIENEMDRKYVQELGAMIRRFEISRNLDAAFATQREQEKIKTRIANAFPFAVSARLVIIEASYGNKKTRVAVDEELTALIKNDRLSFNILQELGDPAPGNGKFLIVRYAYDGKEYTERFPGGDKRASLRLGK